MYVYTYMHTYILNMYTHSCLHISGHTVNHKYRTRLIRSRWQYTNTRMSKSEHTWLCVGDDAYDGANSTVFSNRHGRVKHTRGLRDVVNGNSEQLDKEIGRKVTERYNEWKTARDGFLTTQVTEGSEDCRHRIQKSIHV